MQLPDQILKFVSTSNPLWCSSTPLAVLAVDLSKERNNQSSWCYRGRLMPNGPKLLNKLVSFILSNNCLVLWFQSHTPALELHDKVTPLTPLKAKPALSNEDIMRYSRQLLLPELGVQGTDDHMQCHSRIQPSKQSVKSALLYGVTHHNRERLDCPQVSWTYPRRRCWLLAVEDSAAPWCST